MSVYIFKLFRIKDLSSDKKHLLIALINAYKITELEKLEPPPGLQRSDPVEYLKSRAELKTKTLDDVFPLH